MPNYKASHLFNLILRSFYSERNKFLKQTCNIMSQQFAKHGPPEEVKNSDIDKLYKDAVFALNKLQSNYNLLQKMNEDSIKKIVEKNMPERNLRYCTSSGINLNELDALPVIHVTGTKGKGSTSALCESILRHHGYKTGFYSSPHLISVRERIRLNGKPIEKQLFIKHFWPVLENFQKNTPNEAQMPAYFHFLTMLAFNIFIKEKVDIAIIEVGIGGEFDTTNVLRKVPVVGISLIGLDHTSILGNTLEEIAWQKAGIMKTGCQAFTVQQTDGVYNVFKERSIEKSCSLKIVPPFDFYEIDDDKFSSFSDATKINASLAIQLAYAWMGKPANSKLDDKTIEGLKNCRWPGRTQIFETQTARFYFDGAHTEDSMRHCLDWFLKNIESFTGEKILVFNLIGNRNASKLLQMLSEVNFDRVCFVPNQIFAVVDSSSDQANFNHPSAEQLECCIRNKSIWESLTENSNSAGKAEVYRSVTEVLQSIEKPGHDKPAILVTGSLHLIGTFLGVLDPELQISESV